MARPVAYRREDIVAAAMEDVRELGFDRLTTRSVAARLGGSTQPIYREFASIDELLDAVTDRALEAAIEVMLAEDDPESAFLSIGLGYLRFARREPKLFRLLFVSGRRPLRLDPPASPLSPLYAKMRHDPVLATLPEATLRELFRDMLLYTHGLSTLRLVDRERGTASRDRERLRHHGGVLIAIAVLQHTKGFNLEEAMEEVHRCG